MKTRMWLLAALVVGGGCAKKPIATQSGAETALREFGQALVGKDWPRAYQALHPESRAALGEKQFARLGANYLAGIGFEADEFLIRSCDERGSEVLAQARLRGHAAELRTYKDTFTIKRDTAGWGVVLPSYF